MALYFGIAYYYDGSGRPEVIISANADHIITFMHQRESQGVTVYKIDGSDCELLAGDDLAAVVGGDRG